MADPVTAPNPDRDRSRNPRYGDQTACRFCGLDIEYHGAGYWSDRGSSDWCSAASDRYDVNGVPIPNKVRLHRPVSDR